MTIHIPPEFPKHGQTIEHLIVWNFLKLAQAAGKFPAYYDDGGDEVTDTSGTDDDRVAEAFVAVFAVEDCVVYFRRADTLASAGFARFIVGNGADILSDYSANKSWIDNACEQIEAIVEPDGSALVSLAQALGDANRKLTRIRDAVACKGECAELEGKSAHDQLDAINDILEGR